MLRGDLECCLFCNARTRDLFRHSGGKSALFPWSIQPLLPFHVVDCVLQRPYFAAGIQCHVTTRDALQVSVVTKMMSIASVAGNCNGSARSHGWEKSPSEQENKWRWSLHAKKTSLAHFIHLLFRGVAFSRFWSICIWLCCWCQTKRTGCLFDWGQRKRPESFYNLILTRSCQRLAKLPEKNKVREHGSPYTCNSQLTKALLLQE